MLQRIFDCLEFVTSYMPTDSNIPEIIQNYW